jgi:site-specific recombinase XerD
MQPTDDSNTIRGITLVPAPAAGELNEKQELDYRSHRRELIKWCLTKGKDPSKGVGYSDDTIRVRAGHIDRFYRWVWGEHGYTTAVTHDDADAYMEHLAFDRDDMGASTKSKYQKSLKMLFRWVADARHGEEWDPDVTFSEPDQRTPQDYLTRDERRRVREASLDMGSIPHYKSVDSDDRQKWKKYIAICLEKPVDEISKSDWDELTGWKETSLLHVSLDAGFRPIEIERARVKWFDAENDVLRIPADESSKNRENWTVALKSETSDILARWIEERARYEKYEDTDALWLTRRGNPYSSSSLKTILHRACDRAGINTEHRDMTWYSIRHSVGTYMTRAEGLGAAKEQLRHKSSQTTVKYDQVPVEDRQGALSDMG